MGFYFRKSVRFGPLRVNFSKSGIGLSAGIPGFRIGVGPRGNYVQAGAHGFYYRATLPKARSKPARPASAPAPADFPPSYHPPVSDGTTSQFVSIESAAAEQIVDSSSDELLREIEKNHRRILWWRWVAVLAGTSLVVGVANSVPNWAMEFLGLVGIVLTVLTYRKDLARKLTILHYDLSAESQHAFGRLLDTGFRLQQCRKVWHIEGQANVLKRKYHAGAGVTVSRVSASAAVAQPPYMVCNLDPFSIALTHLTLYFFPDRVLVYQGNRVGAISYESLNCDATETQFVESEAVPADSEVVGRTWQYVNKDGSPDRRFRTNRQYPVCRYGQVAIQSDSGLNELLLFSHSTVAAEFLVAVNAVRHAASWRGSANSAEPLDAGIDDEKESSGAGRVIPEKMSIGARVVGSILLLSFVGILAYYTFPPSIRNNVVEKPPAVPVSSVAPTVHSARHKHRTSSTKKALQSPPPPATDTAVKSDIMMAPAVEQSKSPPAAGAENDRDVDLAPVREKDPAGAARIISYCNNVTQQAEDVISAAATCRRNEISAWTRLFHNDEFPNLDVEIQAKCSRPPFPDSYEGRDACLKYELETR